MGDGYLWSGGFGWVDRVDQRLQLLLFRFCFLPSSVSVHVAQIYTYLFIICLHQGTRDQESGINQAACYIIGGLVGLGFTDWLASSVRVRPGVTHCLCLTCCGCID